MSCVNSMLQVRYAMPYVRYVIHVISSTQLNPYGLSARPSKHYAERFILMLRQHLAIPLCQLKGVPGMLRDVCDGMTCVCLSGRRAAFRCGSHQSGILTRVEHETYLP